MQANLQAYTQLENERNFATLFRVVCRQGEGIALEYSEEDQVKKRTCQEFQNSARRTAYRIQSLLGEKHRGRYVGLQLDNCPEWFPIFWGLLMAGYNPILLDFRASHKDIAHLLHEAGAVAIITNEAEPIDDHVIQYHKEEITSGGEEVPSAWKPQWAQQVAFCTSGTNEAARVFVYDESAFVSNTFTFCDQANNRFHRYLKAPEQKFLAFVPLYHIFGCLACIAFAVLGYTTVFLKDRVPSTMGEACRRHRVTTFFGIPMLWDALAARIRSELQKRSWHQRIIFSVLCRLSLLLQRATPYYSNRFAYRVLFKGLHAKLLGTDISLMGWGGAHLSADTLHLMNALGFPLMGGFGMTETGIVSFDTGKSLQRKMHHSLGEPFPLFETKIAPSEDICDGQGGAILVRGNGLHTARLKGGEVVPPERTSNGWFATGDLGTIDKRGNLYLLGRSKDTIIPASGENVYPDELEDHFRDLEGVETLCVLGMKNANGGEAITLVVDVGNQYQSTVYQAELADHILRINQDLPSYKRVNQVFISLSALPMTTTMKVKRQRLKRLLEEGRWPTLPVGLRAMPTTTASVQQAREEDSAHQVKEAVRAVFAEVLGQPLESIRDDAPFIEELGGDSLQALELANILEKKYQIFMPDSVLAECSTVEEITAAVSNQLTAGMETFEHTLKVGKRHATGTPISTFKESREYKMFSHRMAHAGDFNPYFVTHDSVVKDTSRVGERDMINLASYNYLGLSGHPETIRAAQEAVQKYGTSPSGSRLITGEKTLYRELEKELANWKHVEDALVLVSGHATNVTFVGNFCNENDLILYDAISHDSIVQGCRLSRCESKAFPHNDFKALESILEQRRKYHEKVLAIVEGVYSMDGDIAPIPEFVRLKKKYGLFLMVDEAHSTGVLGKTGRGVDEHFGLAPEDIDIRMGTLSKGLGACGGYLAGTRDLIQYLRYNLPGFVFSVGISPPVAAAALAAIRLIQKDHSMIARLHDNIETFLNEAHRLNFDTCLAGKTAIIPILVGEDRDAFKLCQRLQEKGVFVSPAVYPAVPRGQARLRFCVISEHKKEQILYALDALAEIAHKEGIPISKFPAKAASI